MNTDKNNRTLALNFVAADISRRTSPLQEDSADSRPRLRFKDAKCNLSNL